MRKKIVAGNWKMNTLPEEGLRLANEVAEKAANVEDCLLVVAPPFVHLSEVAKALEGKKPVLAAQNCHQNNAGAYTGEIAPGMLKALGVSYVILGHSERRAYCGENNELLAAKTNAVLAEGMKVIYCCGESLEERKSGAHEAIVTNQIAEALYHLDEAKWEDIVIAYEPVWAIGTGETATAAQAQEMHAAIRKHIAAQYGAALADKVSILYGGSCKPGNAQELFAQADVDGGLIGGAALKAEDFIAIAKSY